MTPDDVVDAVAQVMFAAQNNTTRWDDLTPLTQGYWTILAGDALSVPAVAEPFAVA